MPSLQGLPQPPPRRHSPIVALAAATTVAILGYSAVAVILLDRETPPPPPRPAPPVFALPVGSAPASPPVSILPSPALSAGSPQAGRSIRAISAGIPPRASRSAAHASREPATPSTSPTPVLVVGHTIGLAFPAWPGYLVRHRDHLARVEPVTTASSPADRRAARFVVETGRADPRCLSFASAEHPGFYLRHRDFVLRLEPAEPTMLFQHDATFCSAQAGTGFVLRSANYPSHHLIQDGGLLRLISSAPGQATVFHAVPPI
ncbi:AbfB domain-containing protein [Actinoplanes utahensis]|uniref:AbfB domain-containing protein n=1 Tax=Actinoplanes utahensis TaxID=1869 RepID=UPI000AA3A93D|nr:hypothetical protein Aut01nite_58710 [Actinoplanes utahensis]